LDDQDVFAREAAARALLVWADKNTVPVLIRALDNQLPFGKDAIMDTLVKLKDPRGIEAVAKRLTIINERHAAGKALRAAGPSAERSVLPLLDNNELFVKWEVCDILKAIGTKESLPALQKALADVRTKHKAQAAIEAIKARAK